MTTDDESLLREMWCAYTLHATPKPFLVREAMAAVLAVVREHDATTVAALLAALTDAIDQVEHWAGYADTHYREKWGYEEGVARLRAALKGEK